MVIIKVTGPEGDALGAGFVYDQAGHVVTNYHVVQDAVNDKVEVDFLSGYKAYGTVIGTDLDSDLAVVKADAPASELHPLGLGNSDALSVGPDGDRHRQSVPVLRFDERRDRFGAAPHTGFAAPHRGHGQPFTAGDLIQTDAAINPGNSGGRSST